MDREGGQGGSALAIQISQASWMNVCYLSIYLSITLAHCKGWCPACLYAGKMDCPSCIVHSHRDERSAAMLGRLNPYGHACMQTGVGLLILV